MGVFLYSHNYYPNVNKLLELSPSNFHPKPKVFSSVINIKPLKKPRFNVNLETFEKIVKQAFGNRRKMLRQSLKNLGGNKLLEMSNINSSLRAENLSVEDFCFISNIFDKKFKFHLDRYKYATRYKNVDAVSHRDACLDILKTLDKNINNTKWFFSNNVNKIDISVLPFIRQFRIADPLWFDANKNIPNIQIWLENFLQSKLLNEVMINFDAWEPNDPIKLFPTNL